MVRRSTAVRTLVVFTAASLLSPPALAQQASGIAGVVKDSSGAVLPGVTVEAASPALIEKVRTVVTDGEGQYSVVDLRPGTYVVTFTLPGFSTVKREGIELPGGFTATVNAELRVGALTETVTVSGAAPLVDTRNVQQRTAASAELLAALPSGLKMFSVVMTITPGLTPGPAAVSGTGSSGIYNSSRNWDTQMHGKANTGMQRYDGMNIGGSLNSATYGFMANAYTAEEMTLVTGGGGADSNVVSVAFDMIPKEGGNAFKGLVFGLFSNSSLQDDNLTDALRTRGLATGPAVDLQVDVDGTLGGPIKRDKLWFFTAHRGNVSRNLLPNAYANKTHGTPFYTPDLSKPGFSDDRFRDNALRLTWQASARNKVNVFGDNVSSCSCPSGGSRPINIATESLTDFIFQPQGLYQATWNSPVTSKLLLEAGTSGMIFTYRNPSQLPSPFKTSILDQRTGLRYNSRQSSNFTSIPRFAQRFSVSYVTGSHAFKAGMSTEEGRNRSQSYPNDPSLDFAFLGTVPVLITQFAKPAFTDSWLKPDLGLYVQDSWIIKRLTIKPGVRFDYYRGYVPAQHADAGPWLGARDFAELKDVPSWRNINPRLGVAYDLFGNGQTALKASLGRYNGPLGANATGISTPNNPMLTSVNSVTRTWSDANSNYVPDCELSNFLANGECGQISDLNFGKLNPKATTWSDDVLHGWSARDYTWDISAEVQHQLSAGISVSGGYYRNRAGNFVVTDNVAVTPADYSTYCITARAHPRLPGGGGYPVCGLADISLAKFGQVTNVVTQASQFGKQTLVNNFFNLGLSTRLGSGAQFGGGLDTGRSVADKCFAVDSPQELLYCRVVTPFRANTQLKFFGSYPLPYDIVVSGTFQNMPGPVILANYAARNAEIVPSLGRNLATCGTRAVCTATATGIPLIEPQTQFEGRRTQLNLRLTKRVRVGPRAQLQANVDIFNVLNRSDILLVNTTFGGTSWLQPLSILDARLVQIGGQLTF